MKLIKFTSFLMVMLLGIAMQAQKKDYLSVPGPVKFNQASWNLSWTSHPSDNYYKQEYLTPGEQPDTYKKMLMLDYISGNFALNDVAGQKINELKKLKETNPVVQFQLYENNGEVILDFLLSANDAKGNISIIERNIYRYKKTTDSSGQPGILLFGLSERAYAPDIHKFLTDLKDNAQTSLNAVAAFTIPSISLKGK
ncbi:hypothetical protein ATB99_10950 [Elizabethkingia meningoseptica]|uniref:hypothetical protein n=1 Tax=Elizabethkingia meningoseptica TaxID=238 RepID=UPI000332C1B1|nr:hypothetical protein [Elizabethkingia meningoseptica]AQX06880.1 hypothetical protein BBD33_17140 [Elizabethkingia meningoseptica]AQX48926.1 hypothetical protein B5G46_17125 [Elizabethkingia meningoseptica]EOR28450.1 hypothetical protein L100_16245 [Elizabethkingia meningoseptica ATCC 13253 = NBRC 12535]KUY15012.1 hypothetical protein ATB99_10950 [Elizabethkingia meningoseptica]OPB69617.1 hypothetical protein BAY30_05660 [Elizabethkingia meningoseptica]